ncbi:MAG: TIGR03089 family protein [Pseudonocardiales bacterium]|nr:MAG: TIGR03089 family protein [Pseudonocardiales bacterium]
MTPEQSFADLLAAEPGRPFVTYYDEVSGERSELSAKSLANWVAKTHHLLGTELGLGAGDTALIALPAHWISLPPLLGCLTAGLALTTVASEADVAFVTPATAAVAAGIPDTYAVAPDSAATGFAAEPPNGVQDFVTAVRPQEDKWPGVRFGAGPGDPCMAGRSRAQVAADARARAAEMGLRQDARVLSTRDWTGYPDWIDALLAPLAVGGSVVYVRNCTDPAVLERRATQERVTAVLSQ